MKRILILLVFQFIISGWLGAQNYYKGILEVRLADKALKSQSVNSTNNIQLNKLFTKFQVFEYKQLVPFAKTPALHEFIKYILKGK